MYTNPIKDALTNGKSTIDLSQPDNRPLSAKMLTFPWRSYVINRVKLPLQNAIENARRLVELAPALLKAAGQMKAKFGAIEDARIIQKNAVCLREHKARFMSYENNPGRAPLFSAAFDILISEAEHDVYYADRLGAELEWIIKDILADKWQERTNGQPDRRWWKEPGEYGGKYSIINKFIHN